VTLVASRVSAQIERGATTNRVKVSREPRRKACCGAPYGEFHKVGCPKLPRYRADRKSHRGMRPVVPIDPTPTTKVCITMTEAELEQLDAAAARVQMSRSDFVRRAFKAFAERCDALR
jgi:hypothetical protein